jgi:hypothetical protein
MASWLLDRTAARFLVSATSLEVEFHGLKDGHDGDVFALQVGEGLQDLDGDGVSLCFDVASHLEEDLGAPARLHEGLEVGSEAAAGLEQRTEFLVSEDVFGGAGAPGDGLVERERFSHSWSPPWGECWMTRQNLPRRRFGRQG